MRLDEPFYWLTVDEYEPWTLGFYTSPILAWQAAVRFRKVRDGCWEDPENRYYLHRISTMNVDHF